jgi:hypothetical protein
LDYFHTKALFSIPSPDLLVSKLPALAVIADAARSTIFDAAFIAVAVLIARRLAKVWWKAVALMLGVCILLPLDIRTPGEFALEYGIALMAGIAVLAFSRYFARDNYLAYALACWAEAMRGGVTEMFGTGLTAMHLQGWIVLAVLVASILWALAPSLTGGAEVAPQKLTAVS